MIPKRLLSKMANFMPHLVRLPQSGARLRPDRCYVCSGSLWLLKLGEKCAGHVTEGIRLVDVRRMLRIKLGYPAVRHMTADLVRPGRVQQLVAHAGHQKLRDRTPGEVVHPPILSTFPAQSVWKR